MNRRRFLAALAVATTTQKWRRYELDPVPSEISPSRFPYVQSVQNNKATILWATLENDLGSLRYSPDGVNYQGVLATSRVFRPADTGLPVPYTLYQATLGNLTPNTEYFYKAFVGGATVLGGGDLRFRTAGPGPFNFFVLGDSGVGDSGMGNSEHQFLIARQMLAEKPSMVVHVGDVAYPNGTHELYGRNHFNYYYASMGSVPFFPTPGNHDYSVPGAAPYMAVHSVPSDNVPFADRGRYYSYDWGNVHFVSLDSNLSLERAAAGAGQMLRWLNNDLQTTRQFWRVVYFHHPPYGGGPNQNDTPCRLIREQVVPILETHGVQVVFSGHEHSYQRSHPMRKGGIVAPDTGINYFVAGGGGALLYPVYKRPEVAFGESEHHYLRVEVRGSRMVVHAIRYDGTEIENTTLTPRPVFTDDPNIKPVAFQPSPVAGALVRIVGRSLSTEESSFCTSTLPEEMFGTSVTINDRPIALVYVSNTQIYAQLPFTVEGNITVKVTTANGTAVTSV
ncbi:MAG TPA: metallophosphoesterase [Terriglobia bacterium]|nr:metallophosphoesterase [Terriglobia bacterium]